MDGLGWLLIRIWLLLKIFLISTYRRKKLSFPHLSFFALRLFDIALFCKHQFIFTHRMALLAIWHVDVLMVELWPDIFHLIIQL